jgi:hypothetical protein
MQWQSFDLLNIVDERWMNIQSSIPYRPPQSASVSTEKQVVSLFWCFLQYTQRWMVDFYGVIYSGTKKIDIIKLRQRFCCSKSVKVHSFLHYCCIQITCITPLKILWTTWCNERSAGVDKFDNSSRKKVQVQMILVKYIHTTSEQN